MDFLKKTIADLYESAYSKIEKVETSSNLTKLTAFCNSTDQIFTPNYELFHEPEKEEARESSFKRTSRRANPKISFDRRDMSELLDEISNATKDSEKRRLKIEWWREKVMPKIAELWSKQTVLNLADFDRNSTTEGNIVDLSFRTLKRVNKNDRLKSSY